MEHDTEIPVKNDGSHANHADQTLTSHARAYGKVRDAYACCAWQGSSRLSLSDCRTCHFDLWNCYLESLEGLGPCCPECTHRLDGMLP